MKRLLTFFAAILFAAFSGQSASAGASDWFLTDGARMRLIGAHSPDGIHINAGLEFELEKGWKTYWRSPGGSGLPPQVHFLGSKNTSEVTMELPVPKEFNDYGSQAIGYKKHVVFPITVKPIDANASVTLQAGGVVGICGEICVPVQFQLTLKEDGNTGTQMDIASRLLKAQAGLPVPAHDGQTVISATLADTIPASVSIAAAVPADAKKLELFVEGPSNWYLATAALKSRDAGKALFNLVLHDAPKDTELAGTDLRFTLVADGKGTDQIVAISKP